MDLGAEGQARSRNRFKFWHRQGKCEGILARRRKVNRAWPDRGRGYSL